jgi:regulator of nucleoside diphosphate kinase
MNATARTLPSDIRILRADHDRLLALADQSLAGKEATLAEQLEAELERAILVDEPPKDAVGMNDRVTYEEETSGTRREVTLAWPGQADARAARISVLTPIGVALIGLSVGSHFDQRLPDGRIARLRVVAVER